MPNVVKQMIVRELSNDLKDAESLLFVSMTGLTVAEAEDLRTKMAEHDVPLRMVPNRLTRLALKELGIEPPSEMLAGNVALSWGGPEETIQAAKLIHQAPPRKEGRLGVLGGFLEGKLLDAEQAGALASLPGHDELRAMLLSCLSGPSRGLVVLLAALPGALARVIQAHVDEASGEEAGPEE